jgi:hypothetical protein
MSITAGAATMSIKDAALNKARADKINRLVDRINEAAAYTEGYILRSGDITPTIAELNAYYGLNDDYWKGYSGAAMTLSVVDGKVRIGSMFNAGISTFEKKAFLSNPGFSESTIIDALQGEADIPMQSFVVPYVQYIDHIRTNYAATSVVSTNAPANKSLYWYQPDGKGALNVAFHDGVQWVTLPSDTNGKILIPDKEKALALACMPGKMAHVKKDNGTYADYLCNQTYHWIPKSMEPAVSMTLGGIDDILKNHMDDPVGSVIDGVVIPNRNVTVEMRRFSDFWYGKDDEGHAYVVAQSMGLLPNDNIKDGSMAWSADEGFYFVYKERFFRWVIQLDTPNLWKAVGHLIPVGTLVYIHDDARYYVSSNIGSAPLILTIEKDAGYYVMSAYTLIYDTNPETLGLQENAVIKDTSWNVYHLTTKKILYKNDPSDIRMQWHNYPDDEYTSTRFMRHADRGLYLTVKDTRSGEQLWYRDRYILDNYKKGIERWMSLRSQRGDRIGNEMTHSFLSSLEAQDEEFWRGSKIYADADGTGDLFTHDVIFEEKGTDTHDGKWITGDTTLPTISYLFDSPSTTEPTGAYYNTERFTHGQYAKILGTSLIWNSTSKEWEWPINTAHVLADSVFGDQVKFVVRGLGRNTGVTSDGRIYYSKVVDAKNYATAYDQCNGAGDYQGNLPTISQTVTGGGEIPYSEDGSYLWSRDSAFGGVHTVFHSTSTKNGDDTSAYKFRCIFNTRHVMDVNY